MHRPHAAARVGEPARGSRGNPDTVGAAGGERQTLSARQVDEREDDVRLARGRVCVVQQPLPRAGDARGRDAGTARGSRLRVWSASANRTHAMRLRVIYSGAYYRWGRLSMDATTLSPARPGRFEDEVHELRDVMGLGRDPSPWHDDEIRTAAGAVAGDCRGPRRRS